MRKQHGALVDGNWSKVLTPQLRRPMLCSGMVTKELRDYLVTLLAKQEVTGMAARFVKSR